jgi:hypothetical protein
MLSVPNGVAPKFGYRQEAKMSYSPSIDSPSRVLCSSSDSSNTPSRVYPEAKTASA